MALLLLVLWEPIHLNRNDKGIRVGLHAHKAFIATLAETYQRFSEVAKIIVFPDFFSLVLIIEVGDIPVLRVLEDV
jgi:hypothetical protein